MKKYCIPVLMIFLAMPLFSEIALSGGATAYYSFAFAGEDQMVASTLPGVYDLKKNGYHVDGTIALSGSVENRIDLSMALKTKSMSGSPYIHMQLSPATPGDFSVKLDHIFTRFYLSELLFSGLEIGRADFMINLLAGKFGLSPSDFSQARLGFDKTMGSLSMASSPAVDVEFRLDFPGKEQFYYGMKSHLKLNLAAGGLFGEDIQRLFDVDGGISEHGKEVLGEFAPQFFGDLTLNHFVLPFGTLSASASYGFNSSGIYSGHSAGGSIFLDAALIKEKLFLPISLSGAFYEKNIDVLANAADNELLIDTTDFRNSFKIGFSTGISYAPQTFGLAGPPKSIADLTISGSFTSVGHIYRDRLSLLGLAIDGQYHITPKIYIGGGFILGTLSDAVWKTAESVSSSLDDFNHLFALKDNFGYEAYLGLDFLSFGTLAVGFAHKQGLSMNYGIETIQSGMVKFRQKNSTLADQLWETKGLFIKATVNL